MNEIQATTLRNIREISQHITKSLPGNWTEYVRNDAKAIYYLTRSYLLAGGDKKNVSDILEDINDQLEEIK